MNQVLYVGLDVHKESIVAATAPQGDTEAQLYGTIGGTLATLDKFIKKLETPGRELRFVYEAGPCGYVIYRHLKKRGFHCEVIAPSLIPTKAGNGACRRALVEAAHHYRIAPRVTPAMQKRQEDQSQEVRAIAFKAQVRLHGRYKALTHRRKKTVVVIAAPARELCGFVWAIARQLSAPHKLKQPETTLNKSSPATIAESVRAATTPKGACPPQRKRTLKQ